MTKIISVERMPPVQNEEQKRHLIRYVNFINSRPERLLKQKCFHTHHIYPKSIAKKNNVLNYDGDWNLIELTPREHFIAHMILWKCGYIEMIYAFHRMYTCKLYNMKITSRQYEKILSDLSNKRFWVNDGKNNYFVPIDSNIDEKYEIGRCDTRYWVNNGIYEKQILVDEKVPKNHKIGRLLSTTKNTMWITNGLENKMIPKNEKIPTGFYGGVRFKIKNYKLITNGVKNKYLYENEKVPSGWYFGFTVNMINKTWINNGHNNKRWNLENEIPKGYKLGRIVKGFFITNGKTTKLVQNENDIPKGWKKGRTQHKSKTN